MIGRLGTDEFGKTLRSQLRAVGVDTQFVADDAEAATGVALISVDDNGQNSIIVAPGANARVTRRDVDAARDALRQAKVVVAQLEIPIDTAVHALRIAHDAGALTILNPAPAQTLSREILQSADVIVPNETEAAQLTNLPVIDLASAAQAASVLREMGARPCWLRWAIKGQSGWMKKQAHCTLRRFRYKWWTLPHREMRSSAR